MTIQLIIAGSIICLAIHWLCKEGELLGFLAKYGALKLAKPLYYCMACMGSVWGVIIYTSSVLLLSGTLASWHWLWCLTYCLLLSGVNRVVQPLVDWLYIERNYRGLLLEIRLAEVRKSQQPGNTAEHLQEVIETQQKIIAELQEQLDGVVSVE